MLNSCLNCENAIKEYRRKYCSGTCNQTFIYKMYIERWKSGTEDGVSGFDEVSRYIHRYLREKFNNSCQECGWQRVSPYTNKVPLCVEHINGDWRDNKESNLKLLCFNCHSLTSTFGSLNKGRGRHKARKERELV